MKQIKTQITVASRLFFILTKKRENVKIMANNRIPYGIAKRHGIDTTGMSPKEAWDALKERGITKESAIPDYNKSLALEREKLEKRYGGGGEETKYIPQATEYNRPKTKHHKNHAKEMNLNEREYVNAAIEFFNGDDGELYYSERQKKFYRYDKKTGRFAVATPDGKLRTYYKISKKEFDKKIEHGGLKKWEKK